MSNSFEQQEQERELALWRADATPEMLKNYITAKAFFEPRVKPEELISHIFGVNLREPVEVTTLRQGEILQRYEHPLAKQELQLAGGFLTAPGTPAEFLGIHDVGISSPSTRKRDFFAVTTEVPVLKATAATFGMPGKEFNTAGLLLEGGGIQYFLGSEDRKALERVVHQDHALKSELPRPEEDSGSATEKSTTSFHREESQTPSGAKLTEVTFTPRLNDQATRTSAERKLSRGTQSDFGHFQALQHGGPNGPINGSLQERSTNRWGAWRQQERQTTADLASGADVKVRVLEVTPFGRTLPIYRTYEPTVDGQSHNENVRFGNFSPDVLSESRYADSIPPPVDTSTIPSLTTSIGYDSARAKAVIDTYKVLPGA